MRDWVFYIAIVLLISGVIALGLVLGRGSYALAAMTVVFLIVLAVEYKMLGWEDFDIKGQLKTFFLVVLCIGGGFGIAVIYTVLEGEKIGWSTHIELDNIIIAIAGMFVIYWVLKKAGYIRPETVESVFSKFKGEYIKAGNTYLVSRGSAEDFIEHVLMRGHGVAGIYGFRIDDPGHPDERALEHPDAFTESPEFENQLDLIELCDERINYFAFALTLHD